ncbi:ADP/ATP-dependent (S)-NAD(P)H-hydrate dehydratase [Rhodoluna sp. KAS3]|uniref:ADP-dependent NAD(P)H-hydrate dehydratase n=1 Tax=Rhodoluna sp. KAS3 TaxID=942880 RepID=UPI00222F6172|nr:ADP/ATP-dependent (S)-NAD(P)H-hydrate dehydratase [Rhodoluna sp. KAS3]BDS49311.1 hypothetical protein RKAS3_08880 [Rhodoluna sp. KAS3]
MESTLNRVLHAPKVSDDKYSRGVVGFVTGSNEYPGAAILGVTAAIRTGIGMVRYLGPEKITTLLIEARPEVVFQPGRAQAWVVGSGVDPQLSSDQLRRIKVLASQPGLLVVDAGALEVIDFATAVADCVLTPHAGEMVKLLARYGQLRDRAAVETNPSAAALLAAKLTGQTVLLKGPVTVIATPDRCLECEPGPADLATAGTGDVLAGIIGALLASNAFEIVAGDLSVVDVLSAAVELHSAAARLAAEGGPIGALDVAESVREIVRRHLA